MRSLRLRIRPRLLIAESEVADSATVKIQTGLLMGWLFSRKQGSGCAGLMTLAGGQTARRRGTYWNWGGNLDAWTGWPQNAAAYYFLVAPEEREESVFLSHPESAIVTGAFSYIGRYVAERLLGEGVSVRTLTRNPRRESPFGDAVKAFPLDFSDPDGLHRSMEGAGVLYNTYWIRFARGWNTFDQAVENSKLLFEAAADAGVERVVHFSVANASSESRLPYFRGKGQVEEILKSSGLSYAIIRTTLVFGEGDLLLNNMTWALRRFPVFPVFGNGDYRVQPIYAEDLAGQAVVVGAGGENSVADAAGPESFTFEELLRLLALAVRARIRLVNTPAPLGFALTRLVGLLLRDVVLTRDEVDGLMAGLLTSDGAPTGVTRLGEWLTGNADALGRQYVSEIQRNFRWARFR